MSSSPVFIENGPIIYIIYISLTPNIYLISLVVSEFGRLSLANEIDARHKEELKYDVYCNSRYLYQCYSNNLFWGCLDSTVGRGDG